MRKACRVIFSRYFISAAVILTELSLIFYLVTFTYEYSRFFITALVLLELGCFLSLITRNANPEFKVSWLVVLAVPLVGSVLYLIFYSRKISKKEAKLMMRIAENIDTVCHDRENNAAFAELSEENSSAYGKVRAILNDDMETSIYKNTESTFFSLGEDMHRKMLSDIESAKRFIFLEYFIIEEGFMWESIHELLLRKVNEGVEVRVLYDDIGCMKTLPAKFARELNSEGIKCLRFFPVTPRITSSHNNRDHRKILIIDGKIGYTGGINIADEYINRIERFGHWKDGGVRLAGDAVRGLLKLYLSMWEFSAGKVSDISEYFSADDELKTEGDGYYVPFGSGPAPIYTRPTGKNVILNIVNQARKYVYITTPYLIIDYDLTESLRNAALRGVDIRIITPAKADKRLIKIMTKSSYAYLMEAGVKIYEYTPGFIHEKTIVSDGLYAVVGTINLDYRSLTHHFENAVWMYKADIIPEIKNEFLSSVEKSSEVEIKDARLNPAERFFRNLLIVFAPLL